MTTQTALSDGGRAQPRFAAGGVARDLPLVHVLSEGRGFIPSVSKDQTSPLPLALTRPRNASSVFVANSGTSAGGRLYKNQILIANPRLKFRLTHIKINLLQISNREYFAIFS